MNTADLIAPLQRGCESSARCSSPPRARPCRRSVTPVAGEGVRRSALRNFGSGRDAAPTTALGNRGCGLPGFGRRRKKNSRGTYGAAQIHRTLDWHLFVKSSRRIGTWAIYEAIYSRASPGAGAELVRGRNGRPRRSGAAMAPRLPAILRDGGSCLVHVGSRP
jgi:hypothetical protein